MTETKQFRLTVRVQANAKKNSAAAFTAGTLQVKIAAPAVDGKANEALLKYMSEIFSIPKSRIEILKGATARTKIIGVNGITEAAALAILQRLCA